MYQFPIMKKALELLRTVIEFLGRLTGILRLMERLRRHPENADAANAEPDGDEPADAAG